MPRRAKYVGPLPEVAVYDPEADIYARPWVVCKDDPERDTLPAGAPARVHRSLIDHSDDWVDANTDNQATEPDPEPGASGESAPDAEGA